MEMKQQEQESGGTEAAPITKSSTTRKRATAPRFDALPGWFALRCGCLCTLSMFLCALQPLAPD